MTNSKTQEVLDRLPERANKTISRMKAAYNEGWMKHEIKQNIIGYIDALEDLHFVTDVERRLLYIYMTL